MVNPRTWHPPLVGWIAVLGTALAAADSLLTRFGVGAWLAPFSDAQVTCVATLPFRIVVLWPA